MSKYHKGQYVLIDRCVAELLHRLTGIKGGWAVRFVNPQRQIEMFHCWNEQDMKPRVRK